ncbi:MAG: hypothetical protein KBC84_09240 [Proteobacteria bacterium]|nr:hypothetical protein [Pseudomonadota bacterium]
MATYYSNRTSSNNSHSIKSGFDLITDFCIATDASTALVLSDVIKLFTIPKGAIILSMVFGGTARNSGNDRVVTVGDASDTDRFLTTSAGTIFRDSSVYSYFNLAGQGTANHSGTGSSAVITRGLGYKYTEDTDLQITVTTAGTGNAADWVLSCAIQYYIV